MARPPTMRDIARLAGVGKATVSLALRNDPRIRERTREKIRAVANELGYRADAAVSQVMARLRASDGVTFRGALGVIDVASVIDRHCIRPIQEVYSGCRRRADELGYTLDLFHLNDPHIEIERLPKVIDSRGIRAVLYIGSFGNHSLPPEFAAAVAHLPSVAIDLSDEIRHLNRADTDLYEGVYDAVGKMYQLGYRKPGLITFRAEDRFASYRLRAGFMAGCHAAALSPLPVCEIDGIARIGDAGDWYSAHRPDAILIPEAAVKDALSDLDPSTGLAVLDWTPDLEGWAGIDRNRQAVGSVAIELLSAQIQRNETGAPVNPRQLLVGARWIEGASLPRRTEPRAVRKGKPVPVAKA